MKINKRDEQAQDFVLLHRVAQRINSNLDLDSLLEEIVNDVSQTIGCSRLAVLLKDDRTNELVVGADCGGDANQHMKGDRFKIGEYGMVGHVGATEQTYYAPDVSVDPYYRVSDSQTRSEVDIPLRSNGKLIGVFNAQHKELNAFTPDRIELLEALAGHIATAIENARMFQRERNEKERMSKELLEAQSIQRSLFPPSPPVVSGFTVDGTCLPCREVGGDWFDYVPLSDGRLAVVLADVSGKGMGAAMLMSSTRSVLRLVAESGLSPAKVLGRVNHVLLTDFPAARFVTMVYAILDPKERSVVFANAGHCLPLLIDGASLPDFLSTDAGLPLGVKEISFSERTVIMKPGSRLVFYSDGLTEAINLSLELYGEKRLTDKLSDRSLSIADLLRDVETFREGYPVCDDLTVVMIEAK
ncbi:MAG TPA: GAF domain-containing SpoIIE family protein phosphatase [Candidatus Kryptonia bacterium]